MPEATIYYPQLCYNRIWPSVCVRMLRGPSSHYARLLEVLKWWAHLQPRLDREVRLVLGLRDGNRRNASVDPNFKFAGQLQLKRLHTITVTSPSETSPGTRPASAHPPGRAPQGQEQQRYPRRRRAAPAGGPAAAFAKRAARAVVRAPAACGVPSPQDAQGTDTSTRRPCTAPTRRGTSRRWRS